MAKGDVVTAQAATVVAAQEAALEAGIGAGYDAGFADGVASVPAPGQDVQSQIDAAVAAKGQADAAQLAQVQASLDAETAKEGADETVIAAKQALLDQISAILNPAPAPAPAPVST